MQQFVGLLTRLADRRQRLPSVLISHPSLTGISTDTGLSGTTQWHNAVRARFYIKGVKPGAGEAAYRVPICVRLVFKKNQLRPNLRNHRAALSGRPIPAGAGSDQSSIRSRETPKADEVFLTLLRRFTRYNRKVADKPGTSYAPALFAKEDEAIKAGLSSKNLAASMRELFKAEKIWNEPYGRPLRPSYRIVIKDGAPE